MSTDKIIVIRANRDCSASQRWPDFVGISEEITEAKGLSPPFRCFPQGVVLYDPASEAKK